MSPACWASPPPTAQRSPLGHHRALGWPPCGAAASRAQSVSRVSCLHVTLPARSFPRDEVAPIITARVDEIAAEIKKALEESGVKLGNWSNVYLTGGGVAFNRGGKDYLSSKLGRPVRETPKRTVKMSSPIYSSTMGLMDLIIDTMEQQRQPASGVAGKLGEFFKSLVGG